MKDLLDAILEPGGLSVRFQPIVEVHGEEWRLHGVECLMRGPKGTNLESADILFDYVRRKREESLVDRACVRTAFAALRELPGLLRVSVNVHASTLGRDRNFVGYLKETASAHGLALDRLTVEIVEHAPPWDGHSFLVALDDLRAVTATGIELVQGWCFCAAVPASVLALSRFLSAVPGPAKAAPVAAGGH